MSTHHETGWVSIMHRQTCQVVSIVSCQVFSDAPTPDENEIYNKLHLIVLFLIASWAGNLQGFVLVHPLTSVLHQLAALYMFWSHLPFVPGLPRPAVHGTSKVKKDDQSSIPHLIFESYDQSGYSQSLITVTHSKGDQLFFKNKDLKPYSTCGIVQSALR